MKHAAQLRFGGRELRPLGHGDAVAFGERLKSLRKRQSFDLLHKVDQVAFGVAAEALVKLARLVDVERRSFLLVKRAQSRVTSGSSRNA